MAISVQFEIGHTAKLRAKKTPEGFTHDWDLYVRGSNKADISAYVDKVVFNLHESFPRPKRVIKEPPYAIHESGYAGFMLNIHIYFRNRDEPKRVQYDYDLDLQQQGPPHHRSEERKFIFTNPSEEFRQKLLKGGGIPVMPAGLTGSRSGNPNMLPTSFSDLSGASATVKHKSSNNNPEGSGGSKKHKSRIDDSKLNSFANLFGTPDTNAKSSTNVTPKTTTETLKTGSGSGPGKMYSPSSTGSASSNNTLKEKSSKEGKEKSSSSSSAEKSKDKSERKEKHKSSNTSSPNKEARMDGKKSSSNASGELGKSEKRSEDKPKKDKSRDKDRDRSRSEQSSSGIPNSSNMKPSSNSKPSGNISTTPIPSQQSIGTSGAITNTSAQRPQTQISTGVLGRTDDRETSVSTKSEKSSKSEKSEKETKEKHSSSSSSGKKSKKDKKDKDKDKDKDKERDKEKRSSSDTKSKDERSHISALQSNMSNSPSGQNTPNSLSSNVHLKPTSTSSKKSEKDNKQDSSKGKSTSANEKTVEKHTIPTNSAPNNTVSAALASDKKAATVATSGSSSSNSTSTTTKTHKHKKKDKNKDKDKDRNNVGDKEKDRSKEKHNKDKPEEKRETEKPTENVPAKSISPELKKTLVTPTSNTVPPATTTMSIPSQSSNNINSLTSTTTTTATPTGNESTVSSKKSQSKEKKSKDSKSSKDSKRRSESTHAHPTGEPKNKVSKTSTPLSTAGSNIELSDADSRHSTHETIKQNPSVQNMAQEAPELHSDSSYSSFPEIPVKQTEKPTTQSASTSPDKGSSRTSTASSKENKQREKEKPTIKPTEKLNKTDKEEKKRRRNTVTASNETTTFVEPPIKLIKKDQNKATPQRDSTKSPLPRNNSSGTIGTGPASNTNINNIRGNKTQSETNNQDVEATSTLLTTSPNAIAHALNNNSTTNHTNNISNHSTQQRTTPLPASPALNNDTIWPNLSELQELHRKIMTLQDNDDLQQVVEMIAASGCYELTQRTFDFDLCKLDRSTVERLQEFFATSVS